jgi:hypothetical protein
MLPTKFRFIWPSGFRGEEFKKSANQRRLKCEKLTDYRRQVMAKAHVAFGKAS